MKPVTRSFAVRSRGLSLIEVLVAIVVLSLGLLGMAGLQLSGMRASQGALLRSQAMQAAADLAERMRANRAAAPTYTLALNESPPGTPTSVRDADLRDWRQRVQELPAGQSSVAINGNVVTITVQWDDRRAGGSDTETIALQTRVWNVAP
jgi:type IV pilus assembly protein PilV